MDVGFERLKQLGFEHERLQIQSVQGVLLHDLNQRRREELADVAEPLGHSRRRCSEAAAPAIRAAIVEGGKRGIHPAVPVRQPVLIVFFAKRELPPPPAFVG